jgi:hypothetical protein
VLRPGLLPSYSRFIQWREQAIEAEEEVVMMVGTVVVEEVMEGEEEMVVVVAGMMVVVLAGMVAVVELAGMMVLVVLAGMTVLVVLAVHVSIGGQTIKVAVVVLHPVKVLVDRGAQGVVDHIQSGMEVLQPVKVV